MARLTWILILFSIHYVNSFNILAIISMPLKSHYMAFKPLFLELANRGHNVTIMNNFPEDTKKPNLKYIDIGVQKSGANYFTGLDYYEGLDSYYILLANYQRHVAFTPEEVKRDCDVLLIREQLKSHVAKKIKYDVIFVEQFMSDCALAWAGAMFDAPIISITSHVLLPWTYPRVGLPFDLSADAFYFSDAGPTPSLYYRVEAYILHQYFNTISRWYIQKNIYDSFREHLPEYQLDVERIARERMKMVFAYQHFSLTGARVLAPQLLEIGGLHIGKPKALPQNLKEFLDKATHGAIYVSYGSNLKPASMSEGRKREYLKAFQKLSPMKVLVKWENSTIVGDNILSQEWFPQLDILCHPNVRAFVSHGGMLGTSEATSCGVPMVITPFFGDQFGNAAIVQHAGFGKILYFKDLNAESLYDAVKEVTTEKMRKKAKEVSALWHDRPMSAMDSAIYWTEYVARHPNQPPSLPSKNVPWFTSTLIDVYSVLISILLVLLLCLYLVYKMLKMFVLTLTSVVFKRKVKCD